MVSVELTKFNSIFPLYHPNNPYSLLTVHAKLSASAVNIPNPGDDNGPSREVHEVLSPSQPSESPTHPLTHP